MKLFIVVLLCALAVAVKAGPTKDEKMAEFMTIATACKEETGATDDDVETMMKHELAKSKAAMCFTTCIMKKLNVMDENGKFVKDVAMKLTELYTQNDPAKMKIAEGVIDACKDIPVSDDHCEASHQYKKCMKEEVSRLGVDPEKF